jgi:hypothetical protein
MKENKIIAVAFVAFLFLLTGFKKNIHYKISSADKWTGTVSWLKTSKGKARRDQTNNGHPEVFKWDDYFAYHLDVNFVNSKGKILRADTSRKWEKDSTFFANPDVYMVEERTTKIHCNGSETLELEIRFSDDRKTYWISFFTPTCPEFHSFLKVNNIYGNSSDSSTTDHPGIQIDLPASFTGHPVGTNPNILSGTWREVIPPNPSDPSSAEITTEGKWDLKKAK